MSVSLKQRVARNLFNIRGWKTKRKIVVLESDDWGSIRMPSKDVYDKLLASGIEVNKCSYCKYDSLETEKDLNLLFDVLLSCKTGSGQNPVITANTIVANPDFEKIKESDYKEYYFENSEKTFERFPDCKNSFNLWKKGITENIFHPQLHGREHLNVNRWMRYLQEGSKETLYAFENNMFGISTNVSKENRRSYMAALDFEDEKELAQQKEILKDAQNIFQSYFGYNSLSFIAPNHTWSSKLEPVLSDIGVKYLQGARFQVIPHSEKAENKNKKHYTGESNSTNQYYLVRNSFFEPALMSSNFDSVNNCLHQIDVSFRWNKPAIISTHRLNYMGSIVEQNRTQNLSLLKKLLTSIIKKWPDVEFFTSDKLGELIADKSQK